MHDRRKTPRTRTYIGGQIASDPRHSLTDVLVRNISAGGAKLVLTRLATLPPEFDLSMHQNARSVRAKVVWRRLDEAGVAFLQQLHSAPTSLDVVRRLRAENAALRRRVEELSAG